MPCFHSENTVHGGERYLGNRIMEIYFEGNKEVWFLDDRYRALNAGTGIRSELEKIGIKSAIQVKYRKPNYMNNVIIANEWGQHRRGLDGFDPDCEVEGLEHALQKITNEKAKILWHIAKSYCKTIYGEVETSSKQNYEDSAKWARFSKMGKSLTENSWLPNPTSSFSKPSDLMLSEIPFGFDKDSPEAKLAATKLCFKLELDQEMRAVIENTPDEAKEILELYITAPPEIQQRILESARQIKMSKENSEVTTGTQNTGVTISISPSSRELEAEFKKSLTQDRPPSTSIENKTWTGPTPEQEEKMREYERETLKKLLKTTQSIQREQKK